MLGRGKRNPAAVPPQTPLLSRRAVIGGAGVVVGAVLGGVGSAVGTDLYNSIRSPSSPSVDSQRKSPRPVVTVTTVGIAPKCGGYRQLVKQDPNEAAAEIARLPEYPVGRSNDRESVRAWLRDPASRSDDAVWKWLLRNRAVTVPTWVRVIVENQSDIAVVLTGLRLVIHDRRPTYGTLFESVWCNIDAIVPRKYRLDLREPVSVHPIPGTFDRAAPGTDGPSVDFPLRVSPSDPEVLDLTVGPVVDDCLWTAELDWTAAGQSSHTAISDRGNPFHASAALSI